MQPSFPFRHYGHAPRDWYRGLHSWSVLFQEPVPTTARREMGRLVASALDSIRIEDQLFSEDGRRWVLAILEEGVAPREVFSAVDQALISVHAIAPIEEVVMATAQAADSEWHRFSIAQRPVPGIFHSVVCASAEYDRWDYALYGDGAYRDACESSEPIEAAPDEDFEAGVDAFAEAAWRVRTEEALARLARDPRIVISDRSPRELPLRLNPQEAERLGPHQEFARAPDRVVAVVPGAFPYHLAVLRGAELMELETSFEDLFYYVPKIDRRGVRAIGVAEESMLRVLDLGSGHETDLTKGRDAAFLEDDRLVILTEDELVLGRLGPEGEFARVAAIVAEGDKLKVFSGGRVIVQDGGCYDLVRVDGPELIRLTSIDFGDDRPSDVYEEDGAICLVAFERVLELGWR
jgi:hypothetical protein